RAIGQVLPDEFEDGAEARVLGEELTRAVAESAADGGALDGLRSLELSPGKLADHVAAALQLDAADAAAVLGELDVRERIRKVIALLLSHRELAQMRSSIGEEVRRELGKHQREALL